VFDAFNQIRLQTLQRRLLKTLGGVVKKRLIGWSSNQ